MRVLLLVLAIVACKHEDRVAIGAAAVLRNAMPELVERYRATSGARVEVTYGASDRLARKTLDGFVLAEHATLDALIAQGRVPADRKRVVAKTTLVLVGTGTGSTFASLASLPAGDKIAIGDPVSVPAGRYAREYLTKLGVWDAVEPRLVYGGDVAGVLAHALRGTARVAIVYRTDLENAGQLAILDAPADAPVVTIVAGSTTRAAKAFVDFMATPDARTILAKHGFVPP